MALLSPLALDAARELGHLYGLEIVAVEPLSAGSVNSNFRIHTADSQVFFARLYEEQEAAGAAAEAVLLHELSAASVPVVAPLSPRDASVGVVEHAGKPFAIFPWVVGVDLCLASVTQERCRRLGEALARVHLATTSISRVPEGRFGVDGLVRRLDWVASETQRYAVDVARIRERLEHYVSRRDPALPRGVTHGDLFRDNVLWRGDSIGALLDFESACEGPFVYDLMVCILSWCYTSKFELDHVRGLVEGYQALRPLQPTERRAAVTEGAMACLRFATTRLTDFELRRTEGAPPVRDFRRFLGRLTDLEAGELDSIFNSQGT